MSLRDFVQPAALQQPLICSFTAPLGANSQWQGITLLQLLQSDQRRGIVNIPVENGKVARALRNMTRTLWNESLPEQIRSRQRYIPKSKQRVLQAKDAKQRISREEFNEKLRWALKRKARGF